MPNFNVNIEYALSTEDNGVLRKMSKIKAVLVGFGNVGRHLSRYLVTDSLIHVRVSIEAVLSSSGGVIIENTSALNELLKLAIMKKKLSCHSSFREGLTLREVVDEINPDIAFVMIPPNYKTGEPNWSIYMSLIERGVSLITADKTSLSMRFIEFMQYARQKKVYVGYRATVSAGTPMTDIVKGLRGRDLKKFYAILNSTTNYILERIAEGLSTSDAIKEAIDMGLAEPDPSIDIDGWDPAAKITILANIAGLHITLQDVNRLSLGDIDESVVRKSFAEGKRMKYVAEIDFRRRKASVKPKVLDSSDPLFSVSGILNGLLIELEDDQRVFISGPAGPAWRTARVMITDFMEFLIWSTELLF